MINRLILASPSLEASSELRWAMRGCDQVEVHLGRFEDIPAFDCVATAGNSFGLMNAGMDLAVLKLFGEALQERIQTRILKEYLGEQPVGTSIVVPTGHVRKNGPWGETTCCINNLVWPIVVILDAKSKRNAFVKRLSRRD